MSTIYIITGTSRGIGRELALNALESEKDMVYGFSREQFITHPRYFHQSCDLSEADQIKKILMPDAADFSKICLINNAGMLGDIKHLEDSDTDTLIQTAHLNYISPMLLSAAFLQKYKHTKAKKIIINISSGAATAAYASWAAYCSTKAAIEMLTECINKEQEALPYPTIAYAIAPGVVNTAMQDQIRQADIQDFAMVNKFIELYDQGQLYDPRHAAGKILDVIRNTDQYTERSFRIQIP